MNSYYEYSAYNIVGVIYLILLCDVMVGYFNNYKYAQKCKLVLVIINNLGTY